MSIFPCKKCLETSPLQHIQDVQSDDRLQQQVLWLYFSIAKLKDKSLSYRKSDNMESTQHCSWNFGEEMSLWDLNDPFH